MSNWKFWVPTKNGQVSCTDQLVRAALCVASHLCMVLLQSTQQGGAFIFKGNTCVWQYLDPATAAHVNAQQLLKRTLEIAGKA